MQTVYERCCGLDIHKQKISACLLVSGQKKVIREFGTMTKELKDLADWLLQSECQMTAMESTGSYWKPVYNVLEAWGLDILVVNPAHMKTVPGRKTDVKDAEWIADLLKHGLLKGSYIPDREQRELREVSRYRKSLVEERSREINRLEKMLEGANVKISSVASNVNGVSSRNLIQALLQGTSTEENAVKDMVYGKMKEKVPAIMAAIDGFFTPMQRKLIMAVCDHIDDMTRRINELNDMITGEMQQYEDAIKKIDEIPGIGQISAQTILAEIGLNMDRFPTASHLASWAGLCPGNNESAGKRKSGRTRKGNKTLKAILIQCAKSAVKNKESFFKARYDRLVVRRGSNRATVAVAHSMLIAIYNILKYQVNFKDLGESYYRQFNVEKKVNYYLKKLKELGCEAALTAT